MVELTTKLLLLAMVLFTNALHVEQNDQSRSKRSSGVSLLSLQAMVEQQATVIQMLQSHEAAMETQLKNDQNRLAVTEARLNNTQSNQTVTTTQLKDIQNNLAMTQTQLKNTQSHLAMTATQLKNTQSRLSVTETQMKNTQNRLSMTARQLKDTQNQLAGVEDRMAKTVSFTTHFSQDPVNIGQYGYFKFDTVLTNVGGGYNPHTGIFTAPTSGLYVFHLELMDDNTGWVELAAMKDGSAVEYAHADGPPDRRGHDDQGGYLFTIHLTQGQRVYNQHVSGATTSLRGGPWTVFSGFLLKAD